MKNNTSTFLVTLKTNKEIVQQLKNGKKFNLPFITIWLAKSHNKTQIEYALLVNKTQFKLAVTRNKVKRQLRNILITSNLKGGLKILFKPNSLYIKKNYSDIKINTLNLIQKYQNGK